MYSLVSRAAADIGIGKPDGPQPVHVELLAWPATPIGSPLSLGLDAQPNLLAEVTAEDVGEVRKERPHHVPGQLVVAVDAFEPTDESAAVPLHQLIKQPYRAV